MAGASLIFRYQWLAFWRRALRTGRVKFYLSVLMLLVGPTAVTLPAMLSQAAKELAAGQTASMDKLLQALCVLWLVVPGEELHVSLSHDRLRRFPVDARSLLALRLFSLFLSPIVWLATIVSVLCLSPLLSAPHPLLGNLAAVVFLALTIGVGVSVSQPRGIARWSSRLLVAVAALGAGLLAANPATVVTAVAVATTPYAMAIPVATLLVGGSAVWPLLLWSFRRSDDEQTTKPSARRATSIGRLPGRLGPLIDKEQRAVRSGLDLWMGLLLVLAAAALSLATSRSSTFRQTIFAIVCVLNLNVTLNCLGLDRPAGLTRYLILPIRGMDLFLAKNVAAMMAVTVQLMVLLAVGTWQSGVVQLGAELVVVIVLMLRILVGATSSRCTSHGGRSRTDSRLVAIR